MYQALEVARSEAAAPAAASALCTFTMSLQGGAGSTSLHTVQAESSDMMDEEWNINAKDAENRTKLHNALRLGDHQTAKSTMNFLIN